MEEKNMGQVLDSRLLFSYNVNPTHSLRKIHVVSQQWGEGPFRSGV